KGFATTDNLSAFISEYSDLPENPNFIFKSKQPKDSIFEMEVGSVFGPYEEQNYYKLSKITEKKDVPEAQASHILISFKETNNPNATLTKEEAKAKAESILAKLKGGANFALEAQTNSEDPGSASRGGSLGWFMEGRMVPAFNDWVFSHKKGAMGIVESQFGYHIIKIDDTRTKPGIKLATVARLIEPSDKTLNDIFIEAESFASAAKKSPKEFEKIAEERGLQILTTDNLSRGAANIKGVKSPASQISYWTFDHNIGLNDTRRFDLEKSYVVAQVTGIQEEGTMSVKHAESLVKPILIKEKKAALLLDKLAKGSLTEIANNEKVKVMTVNEATLLDPPSGLRYDKSVIAAMTQMQDGTILRNVVGKSGVYAVQLNSKIEPAALSSYETTRYQMQQQVKNNDMTPQSINA
ncbi:MAG: peptidylprolyl isomerase, partial [Flavobacteriales bacterium]